MDLAQAQTRDKDGRHTMAVMEKLFEVPFGDDWLGICRRELDQDKGDEIFLTCRPKLGWGVLLLARLSIDEAKKWVKDLKSDEFEHGRLAGIIAGKRHRQEPLVPLEPVS